MQKYSTVIIGGGAAGLCAAISLGRRGESVIICEKMPQTGKKILATGNGRCNLLNDDLSETYYNPAAAELVKSIFKKYGKSEILAFFKGLGLETYSQEGRLFPITNQAASVLKVLELELHRLSLPVELNFACSQILPSGKGFLVSSSGGQKIECSRVIIAAGGKSYPAFGSDGSQYAVISQMGHRIIEPVPSVVPLVVKDNLCFLLQGQRVFAAARSIIDGREVETARGELLFTKYGLSGTCILDISESISVALNRDHRKEVLVSIDLVPFLDKEQLIIEIEKRRRQDSAAEDRLAGLLPNKLSAAFKYLFEQVDINTAVNSLKNRRFKVMDTRGWNEAEFTCGGIAVDEVRTGTLESKIQAGVYFAGEILDVNGRRGGYNLAWAWASGLAAGGLPVSSL
jgi:predicted Rossmann fold flavoprotein